MQQTTYRRGFVGSIVMLPMQVFLFSFLLPVNIFLRILNRMPGMGTVREIFPALYRTSDWLKGKEKQREEPTIGRTEKREAKRGWISSAFHLVPGSNLATSVYHYAADTAWKSIEPPSFIHEQLEEKGKEEEGLKLRKRGKQVQPLETPQKKMEWEGGPVSSRYAPGFTQFKHTVHERPQEIPKEKVIEELQHHRMRDEERRPKIVGMEIPKEKGIEELQHHRMRDDERRPKIVGMELPKEKEAHPQPRKKIEVTGVESKKAEVPIKPGRALRNKGKPKVEETEKAIEGKEEIKKGKGIEISGREEERKIEVKTVEEKSLERKGVEERKKPEEKKKKAKELKVKEVEEPQKKEVVYKGKRHEESELDKGNVPQVSVKRPKVQEKREELPIWYQTEGMEVRGLESMEKMKSEIKSEEFQIKKPQESRTKQEEVKPSEQLKTGELEKVESETAPKVKGKKSKKKGKQGMQVPSAPAPPSMEYLLSPRIPPVVWPEEELEQKPLKVESVRKEKMPKGLSRAMKERLRNQKKREEEQRKKASEKAIVENLSKVQSQEVQSIKETSQVFEKEEIKSSKEEIKPQITEKKPSKEKQATVTFQPMKEESKIGKEETRSISEQQVNPSILKVRKESKVPEVQKARMEAQALTKEFGVQEFLQEKHKGKEGKPAVEGSTETEFLSKDERERLRRKKKHQRKRERLLEGTKKRALEFMKNAQQTVEGERFGIETFPQEEIIQEETEPVEQVPLQTIDTRRVETEETEEWTPVKAKKSNIPKHLRDKLRETLLREGIANNSNIEEIAMRICKVCDNPSSLAKLLDFYPFFLKQYVDRPEQAFVRLNQWEVGLFNGLAVSVANEIRQQYRDLIEATPVLEVQGAIRKIQIDRANREKPSEEQVKRTQERIDELYDGNIEDEISTLIRTGKASKEGISKVKETTQALGGFVPISSTST